MADGMSRTKLLRLAQELAHEGATARAIASRCLVDADALAAADAGEASRAPSAVVALGLHRWYSAVEAMLERTERALGILPSGPDWHIELLQGATFEIPKVRPAILPSEALAPLRELLKFRHFLRHAYAVERGVWYFSRLLGSVPTRSAASLPRVLPAAYLWYASVGRFVAPCRSSRSLRLVDDAKNTSHLERDRLLRLTRDLAAVHVSVAESFDKLITFVSEIAESLDT